MTVQCFTMENARVKGLPACDGQGGDKGVPRTVSRCGVRTTRSHCIVVQVEASAPACTGSSPSMRLLSKSSP